MKIKLLTLLPLIVSPLIVVSCSSSNDNDDSIEPTTPDPVSPTTPEEPTPDTTVPTTPDPVSPTTPEEPTPDTTVPTTPDTTVPTTPDTTVPTTPDTTEPTPPVVVDPTTPDTTEPTPPVVVDPTTPDNTNGFEIIEKSGELLVIEKSLNFSVEQIDNIASSVNYDLFKYSNYKFEDDTNNESLKTSNAGNDIANKPMPVLDGTEVKILIVFNTKSAVVYRYGYIAFDEFSSDIMRIVNLYWCENLDKVSDYMIWNGEFSLSFPGDADKINFLSWTQAVDVSSSLSNDMKSFIIHDLPDKFVEISKNI